MALRFSVCLSVLGRAFLCLFFGAASSELRRCNCSVVDESRSSLAGLGARCVSFYRVSMVLSKAWEAGPRSAAELMEAATHFDRAAAMHPARPPAGKAHLAGNAAWCRSQAETM